MTSLKEAAYVFLNGRTYFDLETQTMARAMQTTRPLLPEYPLPSDVIPTGRPVDEKSSFYILCPNCKEGLMIPPSGHSHALRAHKRGVKCRRITEVLRMNAKGLFELGGKNVSKRAQWLAPYSTKGKFVEFFPETIVSFLRWKFGAQVPKVLWMEEELTKFIALSPADQKAHLSGIVLAHEYAKEDGLFGISVEDEIPF